MAISRTMSRRVCTALVEELLKSAMPCSSTLLPKGLASSFTATLTQQWTEDSLQVDQLHVLDLHPVQKPVFDNLHLPGLSRHKVQERSCGTTHSLAFFLPGQDKVLTTDLVLEKMEGGIEQVLELSRADMQSTALGHLPGTNLCGDQDLNVDLMEAGRQGWVRVVVVRGQEREVSWVKYVPPGPQSSGSGFQSKKMNCIKYVENYLQYTGNPGGLSKKNFSFSLQSLGLGEPYEVVEESAGSHRKPLLISYFQKYFVDSIKVDPNRYLSGRILNKKRKVMCKLCSNEKRISQVTILQHMKRFHLPEEACL